MLLITSRETQRWVIPKGNLIKGLAPHEAAAQEAYEEAGLEGAVSPVSIGHYRYDKRRKGGMIRSITVDVFAMTVTGQADEWPEQDERSFAWFTLANAANVVEEPDLKALILVFRKSSDGPAAKGRTNWLDAFRKILRSW